MYRITIDDINIAHLGDLGHVPTEDQLDDLDGVDILLVPVGGKYTIGFDEATHITKEIDPSVVMPMHYGRQELSKENFGELFPLDNFLKSMGVENLQPVNKYLITKDKLTNELSVVVFE